MSMEKIFEGNKYIFRISNFPLGKGESNFSIKATDKKTRYTSFVININAVLSELNVPYKDSPEFWESDWVLNKKIADIFFKETKQMFTNKNRLAYIEDYLDFDRKQGELENYE